MYIICMLYIKAYINLAKLDKMNAKIEKNIL